jgi:DnaK suppressor protein
LTSWQPPGDDEEKQMNAVLTEAQRSELGRELYRRRAELLADIREELQQSDNEHWNDLAERVHDVGDESVADLLSDIDLAVIDRHLQELRDIESAQRRLAMGGYGVCQDCAGPIEYSRLQASPAAARCLVCQQRHERTHAGASHSRL